ncbi:hypothetical protein M758_N004400, partial [Ceratodon purpureus]
LHQSTHISNTTIRSRLLALRDEEQEDQQQKTKIRRYSLYKLLRPCTPTLLTLRRCSSNQLPRPCAPTLLKFRRCPSNQLLRPSALTLLKLQRCSLNQLLAEPAHRTSSPPHRRSSCILIQALPRSDQLLSAVVHPTSCPLH